MTLHFTTMDTLKQIQLPAETWVYKDTQGHNPIIIFLEGDTTPDLILRLWDASWDDPEINFILAYENHFEIVQVPVSKELFNEFIEANEHRPKEERFVLTAKEFVDWIVETREVPSVTVSYV